MKKKILFINNSMTSGGVEKSLVSLLNSIDSQKYDVDLLLFLREGLFYDSIPDYVNVLEAPKAFDHFSKLIIYYIKNFQFISLFRRTLIHLRFLFVKKKQNKYIADWKIYKKLKLPLYGHYDVAIAYNDGYALYYLVDNITADRKIAWNHTEYTKHDLNPEMDREYYLKIDDIVTVSESCKKVLVAQFPEMENKVQVIENIVSKDVITKMAKTSVPITQVEGNFNLISVGRLSVHKGYHIAIDAMAMLKKKGFSFKWYIIGVGEKEREIKEHIKRVDIEDRVEFLHEKSNPYPYVYSADIFVQTSLSEGKSIAIEEAKLLEKPILVTNFETVGNQIEDGKSGIIAEINAQSVAEKLEFLFQNKCVWTELSAYLRANVFSNEAEIVEKFYELIEKRAS